MESDWKRELLKSMELKPLRLRPRDWVTLMLYVDGRRPVKGEESFHVGLFMMECPPLSFKPLLLSVFSPELHEALEELVSEGLVKRDYEYEKGKLVETYKLSTRGLYEAEKLMERVRSSWVIVGDLVARRGDRVISELEALKKTYNGRALTEYLKLILDKLESPDSGLDAWLGKREIEFLKKLYRAYRRELKW